MRLAPSDMAPIKPATGRSERGGSSDRLATPGTIHSAITVALDLARGRLCNDKALRGTTRFFFSLMGLGATERQPSWRQRYGPWNSSLASRGPYPDHYPDSSSLSLEEIGNG
jgi:hypothetical protein